MKTLYVVTKIDEDCSCELCHSTWIEDSQEAAVKSIQDDFDEWKSEFEEDDEHFNLEFYCNHYYCPRFGNTLHYYLTPINQPEPDKVWEVSCEWKTDCDGVQFETHLFHNLADAQEYFRKEREDRISDYQQYCDYVIERDDADAFYIQADEWDTYEQLWINEKEIK